MPLVRIPLANTLGTRDSTLTKDWFQRNCFAETEPSSGRQSSYRRFGLLSYLSFTAGRALGLFTYNNQAVSIIGSNIRIESTSIGTVDTTTAYTFNLINSGAAFFVKNNAKAYYYNGATLAQVTDANYPAVTVPGCTTLDTTTYVMTPTARIYGSNIGDPTTWNALNFISANSGTGIGVCLSSLYNYVVAFCDSNTQLFYDNGNPTGSPLNSYTSSVINVGCASAGSVVATRNTIFWLGKTQQKGRSIYIFDGLNPSIVSTAQVDRVLNADNLSQVNAYFIEIEGHAFYILALGNSNVTLVYDMVSQKWHTWSTSVLGAGVTTTDITLFDNQVTLVIPDHGFLPGDLVLATGQYATSALGTFVVSFTTPNTVTYTLNGTNQSGINADTIDSDTINTDPPITPVVNSITVQKWNQAMFSSVYYTPADGLDLLLDQNNGIIYSIQENTSNDNGVPIRMDIRTDAMDFGDNTEKFHTKCEVIADKGPESAFVGYTDNDFKTFRIYRAVNLQASRSQLRRLSKARRRAYQLIYFGSTKLRVYDLEVNVEKGIQ
jgi:hypothetical protein